MALKKYRKSQFMVIPKDLMRAGLALAEWEMWFALGDLMGHDDMICWASKKDLFERMPPGRTPSWLNRGKWGLMKRGLLKVSPKFDPLTGAQKGNFYELFYPELDGGEGTTGGTGEGTTSGTGGDVTSGTLPPGTTSEKGGASLSPQAPLSLQRGTKPTASYLEKQTLPTAVDNRDEPAEEAPPKARNDGACAPSDAPISERYLHLVKLIWLEKRGKPMSFWSDLVFRGVFMKLYKAYGPAEALALWDLWFEPGKSWSDYAKQHGYRPHLLPAQVPALMDYPTEAARKSRTRRYADLLGFVA